MTGDPDRQKVIDIWNAILERDPTPQEISQYRQIAPIFLVDTARTIKQEENNRGEQYDLVHLSAMVPKADGVSLVSTYNKQCGIATYCENLYSALLAEGYYARVLSDECRTRVQISTEEGVVKCWSTDRDEFQKTIAKAAIDSGAKCVHIQHEFGMFRNNKEFSELVILLRRCGFKVIITLHTVLEDPQLDWVYKNADVLVVHTELAATRLASQGIRNVTVIPHGTERPIDIDHLSYEDAMEFVNEFLPYGDGDILGVAIGFISKNKMMAETLDAVNEARKYHPNLKFLMIGSAGRRDYDFDYIPTLEAKQNENVVVAQRFLTTEQIAMLLYLCEFEIFGYEQTNYSISGASHLAMTYGKATISSNSRILSDLTEDMSMKFAYDKPRDLINCIVHLCNHLDLRIQMGNAARLRGEATFWDEIARRHMKLYAAITR